MSRFSESPNLAAILGAADPAKGPLKIVAGTQAVTTTANIETGLSEIVAAVAGFGEAQVSTNSLVYTSKSGGTLTLTCLEADLTAGTTEANIDYIAFGYE